jgi:DNA-binding transcriptional LysR family regulator
MFETADTRLSPRATSEYDELVPSLQTNEYNHSLSAGILHRLDREATVDIELARTFLEIVRTQSFIRAAEQLNVSQTTVSARIRSLEEKLGKRMFVRNKSGASLTPEGQQFLRYAPTFLQLWERARHQVAIPEGHRASLAVGGELILWHPWMLEWLHWMRQAAPEIALRIQVDLPESLMEQVTAGVLDLAIMYAPQYRPGVRVELLLEENLVLVSSDPDMRDCELDKYVYVDWGPEFAKQHAMVFPEISNPPIVVGGLGLLGLNYIVQGGGCGYFRKRMVEAHLRSGKLHLVPGAPSFSYPVYAVCSAQSDEELLETALQGLRQVVQE